ncbi:putative histidine kinase [Helianthus annuus]|nr:putative histidine kinase [Helianthus annuus]KAJ0898809.1 putative histidine kinase [Helianthus annuus]KAJ0902430.1 putative histidine kinase [Helianthus annuus]
MVFWAVFWWLKKSGVMKLEATMLKTARSDHACTPNNCTSMKKLLILKRHMVDDVSIEVIGDVLRV